jgi:hypothetical protein
MRRSTTKEDRAGKCYQTSPPGDLKRCGLRRVLLDSFISTQKLSVQKTLQRKFRRFVAYKRDFQELLLSALQGLVREQIRYEACSKAASAADPVISVPMK